VSKETPGIEAGIMNEAVNVMETEHDHAGEIMLKIRALTNNYQEPVGACTTFKLSLAELKAFGEDLHRHVHLENNILFPMAKAFVE
jgi:regulator of cell morphogenesis and NO signaling